MTDTISTDSLIRRILRTGSLASFMEKNEQHMLSDDFCTILKETCARKNLVPERVILKAQIDRTYGHQLFNGTRRPSRDKVLQLSIGMRLNMEETQRRLRAAGKSDLYPRLKRDAVIIYCLKNGLDMIRTNEALSAYHLSLLGES